MFKADGSPRLRFAFTVKMARRDRPLLETLRTFLGAGGIHDTGPERAHWEPTSTYSVSAEQDHLRATIPFSETFLHPNSSKYRQFVSWRDELLHYRERRPSQYARGPSTCKKPDCGRPVRGRGLCRHHYYLETGY